MKSHREIHSFGLALQAPQGRKTLRQCDQGNSTHTSWNAVMMNVFIIIIIIRCWSPLWHLLHAGNRLEDEAALSARIIYAQSSQVLFCQVMVNCSKYWRRTELFSQGYLSNSRSKQGGYINNRTFRPWRPSSATTLKKLLEWLDLSTATRGRVCLTGDDDLGEDNS